MKTGLGAKGHRVNGRRRFRQMPSPGRPVEESHDENEDDGIEEQPFHRETLLRAYSRRTARLGLQWERSRQLLARARREPIRARSAIWGCDAPVASDAKGEAMMNFFIGMFL